MYQKTEDDDISNLNVGDIIILKESNLDVLKIYYSIYIVMSSCLT